jgi:hypothetical protein
MVVKDFVDIYVYVWEELFNLIYWELCFSFLYKDRICEYFFIIESKIIIIYVYKI